MKIQSRWFILTIVTLSVSSCQQTGNNPESEKDPKDSSNMVIIQQETAPVSHEEDLSDYFNVCYSTQFDTNLSEGSLPPRQKTEKGFAGIFHGKKIYYETWSFNGGLGMEITYIILRTDTTAIKSFDFCFPELPSPPEISPDSVLIKRYDTAKNDWVIDTNLTIEQIPTVVSPIVIGLLGYYVLSEINSDRMESPKIQFDNDNLYLKFWNLPRYGDHQLLRWDYKFDGKRFRFIKENILKTVKNDN